MITIAPALAVDFTSMEAISPLTLTVDGLSHSLSKENFISVLLSGVITVPFLFLMAACTSV